MALGVVQVQTEDLDKVYVSQSSLGQSVGLGLFAAQDFEKDDTLCYYTGVALNGREAADTKERAYLMRLCKGLSIDAGPGKDVAARYINDNANKDEINVRFKKEPSLCRASVIATRNIKKHEEIFVSYGNQYWKKFGIELLK